MEIRVNSLQTLPRNNSCTNANYISARSCGNGEAKNAYPPFVQSTHKAVWTFKLLLLHHRLVESAMKIRVNSLQTLPRNKTCTNANYIWARSCGNGEAKNANPPIVQSTHKVVRACKLLLLHHRRIVSAMEIRVNFLQTLPRNNSCTNANCIWTRSCGNEEAKNAIPSFVQSTNKAVGACKLFLLHHRRIESAMGIRVNSLQTLPRNYSCTNTNYIWARSCGNGEVKNANPPFVQSTHKAVRAWKLLPLHHRRVESTMEIRENSLQTLPRNNSCTNANYIWARSCGNGEVKNANPPFVQSTHKALRACKLLLLHHRHVESTMEIRVNSLQTLPRNNSCTNANYIWARSCGNGEVKNANPPFVQSTNNAVRACKLLLLYHRRIESAMAIRVNSLQTLPRNNSCTNPNYKWARSCGNREVKNANPPFVQSTHKAVRACKLLHLHHRHVESAMEIRVYSLQTLQRNNSCTNANYIWARSCGNGEVKNANRPLVQSTHKAVRACKLLPLHHRRVESTMEIRENSLQTLPRNISCTKANYIWVRRCGNGEVKNANPPFLQSTHKAVRACKLLPLHHRRVESTMEIRENSLQTLPRNNSCTNANYISARSCGNGEAKNAYPPFVQSTHKAVWTFKLLLLHHRLVESAMKIRVNSLQTLPRNKTCTNANYIWARSCGNGEAKNANPPIVQSTHKVVRACKLLLLHHRRIVSAMEIRVNFLQTLPRNNSCTNANCIWTRSCGNEEAKNAIPSFVQSTNKAVGACKLFLLHHRRIESAMGIRVNSLQTLPRNYSCTNTNYIWARSCGNGEVKNANPPFVQSTHKAVRAWKLLPLHHRRVESTMEIRENSLQTLPRNNSCTNANYIWARSCGNGEVKNANPPFVQSTHKALRACKLLLLHHRHVESTMEIRVYSLQTLQRNNSCTNANYIWARSCGNGEVKNANRPLVQSTHKAVRACKLLPLHHRRVESTMEIRENSLQTLPRNISCTKANYIWVRRCGNGEVKNANPPFLQSTHKAVRACKLLPLHHRRVESTMEIRENSLQTLPRNNSCTNANYISARSCGNGEAKNAYPPFVQSTHKAVWTFKLLLLHHRLVESAMKIRVNSLQTLPRNKTCTNANYIWARSCGNGEAKNANPPIVQSTHKVVRACKLLLLHHRRIVSAMEIRVNFLQTLPRNNSCTNANCIWTRSCGNEEAKNAIPSFVQSTNKAVGACKLFLLHHRRIESAMGIRVNSLQTLPRNYSCTNTNYIWARSCGNGEVKNANPPFVQSTHKAVRAWKLLPLHHRRVESTMEIRENSLQTLPRNNSCTNANYIWARSCGNGEVKNANPPFVQSTHKALRACKLLLLHHRHVESTMEIRVNSLQTLPRNNSCTNANYIWARSCGNGEVKNANPPFVQSTNNAVRACKLLLLYHRRIESAMAIRVNSLQTLPRNNSCTNPNYKWARSCGNREVKNANPPFVQSTHKAVRACKLLHLHHRHVESAMEIRVYSLQTLQRNNSCTNANYIWARSCGNGEVKNANRPLVQSTHKAVRACKLLPLHHRRVESTMEIRENSLQTLPRNISCTKANYIWVRRCGNGEVKNANPPFLQSTHKAVRACKLLLLHHRRVESTMDIRVNSLQTLPLNNSCTNANYIWARSCGNGEVKNANPPFVQSTHKAVRACKLLHLHHRHVESAMEIRVNSLQTLPRNNTCTNANYIWARSCGYGEVKNANPPFVQSTYKAVRACKLLLLHHRRVESTMEIRVNSLQTLPRNNSCTNANYICARSCGNGEVKNANPPFVQSTHKAVRAWKLLLLHHRRIDSTMEIRVNSLQTLPRNNSCTNANYIWARSCGNGEVKNANPPFVQSTHKAVRPCKLLLLHHRRIVTAMEIRVNSLQTLPLNNSCTNANCIWTRSFGNGKAKNAIPPFVQPTH